MYGFVLKNDKQGIVYDGDIAKIDYSMDQLEALTRFKKLGDHVTFEEYNIIVFGKPYKVTLPVVEDPKSMKDESDSFLKYISEQARYKMMSDKTFGIWQVVLKEFKVYGNGGFVVFYPLTAKQREQSNTKKFDGKEKAGLIMLKELLDGDIRLEPYELIHKGASKKIEIGHDYKFDLFNKEIYVPGNYTNALRQAMFKQNTMATRDDLNLTGLLQTRQYEVILNMGRVTSFVAPRRGGKTFLLAYIALKEIIKNMYNIQSRFRPISVLFLGLTSAKNYSVVQYIKTMVKQLGIGGNIMFHRRGETKTYEFRSGGDVLGAIKFISINDDDPGIGDYADLIIVDEAHKIPWAIVDGLMPIVQNEGARLVCASTLYHNVPKNWFYDLVVQGETHIFNIESEVENMYNKHEDLIQKLYSGDYTQDDLMDYANMSEERINNLDYVGMRFTYDDIEYIPDRRKEKVKKEEYAKNPKKFLVSFYSRFPDEGKVFDFETSLKHPESVEKMPYKYIILGYDPALTKDYSALVVMGYNPFQQKLTVLEEHELKKTGRYEDQIEEIKQIQKNAERYVYESARAELHSFFVMDGTQKATAEILGIKGFRVDCKVSYTSGHNVQTKTGINSEHLVPKKYLVELFQEMLDGRKIYINKDLKRLTDEMSNFKMKLMASGYVKYEADTGKNDDEGKVINDDFVNAALLCNYFSSNVLGLKYSMFNKEAIVEDDRTMNMTRKELAKYHNELLLNKQKREDMLKRKSKNAEYYQSFIY